jgi:hypothetical protein
MGDKGKGKGMPQQYDPNGAMKGKGGFDKGKGGAKGGPPNMMGTAQSPMGQQQQQQMMMEQPGGPHSPEAAAKLEQDAEIMMQQANLAVEAALQVPIANGGLMNQNEAGVQQAAQQIEQLAMTAQQKVKQAQEFIMKKLQECSRVQTPSFAKLKASLPKKLSALAQAQPKITKARTEVQKAAEDLQMQKVMSELQGKFSEIESGATQVETSAQKASESFKAEGVDTEKVFSVSQEVYSKKDEFMKKVSDLKTQITGAVKQTMGQKQEASGGLKKGAHELLISIAQLESKVNQALVPILTDIEVQKTEMGVKEISKKVEDAKTSVTETLGDSPEAKVEDLDIDTARAHIAKCDKAQEMINDVKNFHQALLPPGGKGIPKAQFAIRMTKIAPQTQAIQQLESRVFKTRSVANLVIQKVEANEMLEEVQKEVAPAEALSQKVQDTAAPVLSAKPNESIDMSMDDLAKLHEEVAKLGEEAKTALGEVKMKVVTKMREVVGAGESKRALGELNVKLATMEARVRQTVSAVKTAMDMKKVEGETAEITMKIIELEKSTEEAEAAAKEKLASEPTEATLTEIETTVKSAQEKIQAEIKALGEKIQEATTNEPENKTKLQMLGALKGRLEACNSKYAKLYTASKVSFQMGQFERMVVSIEEEIATAGLEVKQAMEDKKTMTSDFASMELEKKIEVATSVYDGLRIAREGMSEKGPKIQDVVRKVNTSPPQYKQQYLDRLRQLQADFQRTERSVGAEADDSMILLTSIKSAEKAEALSKRVEEQKEIVNAYVEEIKPMVEGGLNEEETKEAQTKAFAKIEELEKPLTALSEEITATLVDIPKTVLKVREGFVKNQGAVANLKTTLNRQKELVKAAAGKAKSKELVREASGIVAAIEAKINEVVPKLKELNGKAADDEVTTAALEEFSASFTATVSEVKEEVEKEKSAIAEKGSSDTAKEIPEYAREIIRSTTKLEQLRVKLGSMLTNAKSLVDRRKVHDKVGAVKKELRVTLDAAAEMLKEAAPLETLEGLHEAAAKTLATNIGKKAAEHLKILEGAGVKLAEASSNAPGSVRDVQMECQTTISKLRASRLVAESAAPRAEIATVKEAAALLSDSGIKAPGDDVSTDVLAQLLAGVWKGPKLDKDQVQRILNYLDPEAAGVISKDTWNKLTQKLYICLSMVALTDGPTIGKGCKILRQLEVNETVSGMGEPQLDEKTKCMRIRVKATSDNQEGYATEKGNQGTLYLTPCSGHLLTQLDLKAKQRAESDRRAKLLSQQAKDAVNKAVTAAEECEMKLQPMLEGPAARVQIKARQAALQASRETSEVLRQIASAKAMAETRKDALGDSVETLVATLVDGEERMKELAKRFSDLPAAAKEKEIALAAVYPEALAKLTQTLSAGESVSATVASFDKDGDGVLGAEELSVVLTSAGLDELSREAVMARLGGETCPVNSLVALIDRRYKVVAKVAMLGNFSMADKIVMVRELAVGEDVTVLEGPTLDPKAQLERVKVKAADGAEGWVSVKGNQGTTYLEPVSSV